MSVYKPWKEFERSITRKLTALGLNAKRNWDSQFVQKDGCDIICDKFTFQLKYGKEPSLKTAFHEAKQAAEKGKSPIGVARYSEENGKTLVVMEWKTFESLLKH